MESLPENPTKTEDIDPAVRSQWATLQGGDPEAEWGANVAVFGTFDLLGGD